MFHQYNLQGIHPIKYDSSNEFERLWKVRMYFRLHMYALACQYFLVYVNDHIVFIFEFIHVSIVGKKTGAA